MTPKRLLFPATLLAIALGVVACTHEPAEAEVRSGAASVRPAVVDREIEPWRRELLQLAFEAASKFPSDPHHKNRGRAQDLVVAMAFELEQPKLALAFAPRVEGWRRGVAYADYAWVAARAGVEAEARQFVGLAEQVLAEQTKDPHAQEWRADTVRLKIARALHALGDDAAAREASAKIGATSTGAVDATWTGTLASRVEALSPAAARGELQRIDDTWGAQSLGDQFTSLCLLGLMHRRFFDDAALREQLEERLFERYTKLPPGLRTEAMTPMVEAFVEHDDRDGAREVVRRIAELVEGFRWRTEDLLPQLAAIATLRGRIGDVELARHELEQALERFHRDRDEIVDIFRCEALRPVAVAFAALGDRSRALDVLALAIEEGVENPNSRPRCDDLVETCVAMAKHGIEPNETLWGRLREIRDGLRDPW